MEAPLLIMKENDDSKAFQCMSHSTFDRAAQQVWAVIEAQAQKSCKNEVEGLLRKKDLELVLSGDGAWGHRRGASQGTYIIMNTKERKVIRQVVLSKKSARLVKGKEQVVNKGNYEGTPQGMEGEGFRRAINELEAAGLLPFFSLFICDQDSSVLKIARSDARLHKVQVLHDPGHMKKNFEKDVARVLGEGVAVKGFAARIGRWMMTALKEAKYTVDSYFPELCTEDQQHAILEEFRLQMYYAKAHYFSPQCWHGCPCYFTRTVSWSEENRESQLLQLPDEVLLLLLEKTEKEGFLMITSTCRALFRLSRNAMFLDRCRPHFKAPSKFLEARSSTTLGTKIKKVNSLIDHLIIEEAPAFAHSYHTCWVESLNSSRCKDTPKHLSFPKTFTARAALSVIRCNCAGWGKSVAMVRTALNLPVPTRLEQYLEHMDDRQERDRKRQALPQFKKQAHTLRKKKAVQSEKDKQISKARGDAYLAANQKTAFTQPGQRAEFSSSQPDTSSQHKNKHRHQSKHKAHPLPPLTPQSALTSFLPSPVQPKTQPTSFQLTSQSNSFEEALAVLQAEDLTKLKGEKLNACLKQFHLAVVYQGDYSVAEKRKRLDDYRTNPSKCQHYLSPRKHKEASSNKTKHTPLVEEKVG